MADDRARVVRDWLAAVLALVGIVGAVGAGVVWVAERSVKDAVTEAVRAAVPDAVTMAVNTAVPAAVSAAVQPLHNDVNALKDDVNALKDDVNALKDDVNALKDDVNALKVVQVRASANYPAVAATLFPEALWVPAFKAWAKSGITLEYGPVLAMNPQAMEWAGAPWAEEYRQWMADASVMAQQ